MGSVKTPLEKLLEKGLSRLGVDFGQRIYGEEIIVEANVDNAYYTDRKRMRKALASDPKAALAGALKGISTTIVLSNAERFGLEFFSRHAEGESWRIWYTVYSTENLQTYAGEADRLIREKKISSQLVSLFHDALGHYYIAIKANGEVKVATHIQSESIDYLLSKADAIKSVCALQGKKFNPNKVYRAIMKLLEN